MNRQTLEAVTSSGKDDWETPPWLFAQLDAEFHFTLDPCCTHETAKCAKHYTPEENGLIQDWGGRLFFAILPTPAGPAPTPDRSHGCKSAWRRRKSLAPLWWPCYPPERTRSSFTSTSTARRRSALYGAVWLSWTTARRLASPCLAQ